ncbi:uncharacterized protein LOC106158542 [Lingula anatina]|nr:uncharacterized protein LOC106158542 [Lingula anatina]|eukprot:XP_013390041.1 uncharacterized protein LOC106158542 [Lingula anatina]
MYAIVAAIFCTLFFITGVTLLGMFLTGYLFNFTLEWVIAVFFVLFAVSLALVIYFYSKARVKSSSGRRNVKFRAAGDHQVSVVNVGYENDTQKDDDLVSGKVTNKAVLHVDAPYEQKRAQKYRKAGQPGSRTRSESSQISGDSLDRPPSYREQAMVNAV